jgi:probable rRNA maturation factor
MASDDHPPPLRVRVTDERGRPLRQAALARWLTGVAPAKARGVVTIALVGDATMRRLNKRFAGHDCVTDVLSFLASGSPDPCLGDLAIATGVAARQAAALGHTFATELRVLALHGLLHLLGYDHATDAGQMARIERRLRRKGRLKEGLIDRAGVRRRRRNGAGEAGRTKT